VAIPFPHKRGQALGQFWLVGKTDNAQPPALEDTEPLDSSWSSARADDENGNGCFSSQACWVGTWRLGIWRLGFGLGYWPWYYGPDYYYDPYAFGYPVPYYGYAPYPAYSFF
jgi:hypothetical protein